MPGEAEDFKIQTHFEFGLKLSSVVWLCLGLSANLYRRMIEAGAIPLIYLYLFAECPVRFYEFYREFM